jgi:hypothetical protein
LALREPTLGFVVAKAVHASSCTSARARTGFPLVRLRLNILRRTRNQP